MQGHIDAYLVGDRGKGADGYRAKGPPLIAGTLGYLGNHSLQPARRLGQSPGAAESQGLQDGYRQGNEPDNGKGVRGIPQMDEQAD